MSKKDCIYSISSDSWKYTDERIREDEIIVKLGCTSEIERRKWDYITYLPHKPKYDFWVEILSYGDFEGKSLEYVEKSIFKYPYFKNRNYYYEAGSEFFKVPKEENYKDKICQILLSKNVVFKVKEEDIFNNRPYQEVEEGEEPNIKYKCTFSEKFELRHYQKSIVNEMKANSKGTFILPTGIGKTITYLSYIKDVPQRYLIVVPSKCLINQTYKECKKFLPINIKSYIYKNEEKYNHSVTISTYQSSHKTYEKDWDCIIFDECHNTVTNICRNTEEEVSRFQKLLKNPSREKFFFTATTKLVRFDDSYREEKISMDNEKVYGKVLYEYKLDEAIKEGFLIDYRFRIEISGDKNNKLLFLIRDYSKIMIFCSTKKKMRKVYKYLIENVSDEEKQCIFKLDDNDDTNTIAKKFKDCSTLSILVCCKKAMIGYDEPKIDCVIHYDISSSCIETIQKNGRSLRIHKEKIMATIIFMVKDSSDEEKRKRRIKLLHNIVSVYKFYDKRMKDSIKKSCSYSEDVYKKIEINMDNNESADDKSMLYNRYWNEIISDRITYVDAKNIISQSDLCVESKKDYENLLKKENRLPENPEEYFDQFSGWVDYLSLDKSKYYDLEQNRQKTKELFKNGNVKYNKILLSETVSKLCHLDNKFPCFDMWECFYEKPLSEIVIKPKLTKFKLK